MNRGEINNPLSPALSPSGGEGEETARTVQGLNARGIVRGILTPALSRWSEGETLNQSTPDIRNED